MQYTFDGAEHGILPRPHGNAKGTGAPPSYVRTGLGSPPATFYTNDVESKNRILKYQTSYVKQEFPQFVNHMKELFTEQRSEVEKAVVGMGEYQLLSTYQHLGVETKRWFLKTEQQRKGTITRFMNAQLVEPCSQATSSTSSSRDEVSGEVERPLSSEDNPLQYTSLPRYTQESMWKKFQPYMDDPSYVVAPGTSDKSCVLVKSSSGTKLHFVQRTGKSKNKCDSDCLMFKATSGVCSHTLLTAHLNDEVGSFVQGYAQSSPAANYAQLGQHGLPTGGRKPSSKRKGASKKSTAAVRKLIEHATEGEMTKRSGIPSSIGNTTTDQTPTTQRSSGSTFSSSSATTSDVHPSASQLALCRSTPQPVGPPPLIQCAAPVNAVTSPTQLNIQAVPCMRPTLPQQFLTPSQLCVIQAPSIGFPTDTSSQPWDEMLTTTELQPFWVTFPTARVSRCQGCLGQICHSCTPPWNIALQHKQQVLFQNPNTGTWQLSRDLRNTYYHVSKKCVVTKYPQFRASQSVKISKTVRQCLLPTHFELIAKEFGIDL